MLPQGERTSITAQNVLGSVEAFQVLNQGYQSRKKGKKKPSLLDKKQKALPIARGKRGPITARRVGKKKPVIKQLKRKKSVTWSKVKQFAETREQMPFGMVREGEGHRFQRGGDPHGRAFQFEGPAVQRQFRRRDAAGNVVAFAPRARRVGLVY